MARVKSTSDAPIMPEDVATKEQSPAYSPGMPKPPGQKIGPEAFFNYTSQVLDEKRDWPHLVCYVYRLWPVLTDKTYIDKISMPFGAEYIRREWGSGTYKFSLNDQNIKAKFRTVCWLNDWVIRDPDNPPVIPDLTRLALNDPANKEYVQKLVREGKLDPQGNIPQPASNGDSALSQTIRDAMNMLLKAQLERQTVKGGDAEALEKGMAMLEKAHSRSMDMLQKQNDPSGALQLLSAIKDLMPKPEAQANPTAVIKEVLSLVREMMPAAAAAPLPQSVTGQMKELVEVIAAFRELSGADAVPARIGKMTWPDVIANAVPMLPGILGQAANLFHAARAQVATAANASRPNPAAAAQPGHQAHEHAPAAIAAPPAEPDDPIVAQLAQFLPAIAQPLMNALNAGQSGADFADWVAGGYGQAVYGSIAQMRPDQIRAALERTPPFQELVRALPPGALDQFIDEFLHPDTVEEPAAAAAAAGVQ